jgi:hypothetical protein
LAPLQAAHGIRQIKQPDRDEVIAVVLREALQLSAATFVAFFAVGKDFRTKLPVVRLARAMRAMTMHTTCDDVRR